MIRTLIVEDSKVIQELLVFILSSDPNINIIGVADNGEEAIEIVKEKKPDVITMDIHMPKLDGLKATRKIMETHPTPIIVVSSTFFDDEVINTFKVMEAGALTILRRPSGIGHPEFELTAAELIKTVKLMSEVKVVRRWPARNNQTDLKNINNNKTTFLSEVKIKKENIQIVSIGASTGGPVVLQTILSRLEKKFPVPILITQHITTGFLQGFVEWLSITSNLPVHIATQGEIILPGNVYIAPDGYHMGVDQFKRIILSEDEPEYNLRPAVSFLFRTVASVYGSNAIGVLLTGMGKDGAKELKLMKDNGAITIAQDAESSVIHGMPGEAIQIDAATYILPPERIIATLQELTNNKSFS